MARGRASASCASEAVTSTSPAAIAECRAVTSTGSVVLQPNPIAFNPLDENGLMELCFDGSLEVGEWTTVAMTVQNSGGTTPVCFQIGRHPGDMNMDGDIGLPDAAVFGAIFNGFIGAAHKTGDLDNGGDVGLPDAAIFGASFSAFIGAQIKPRPPCICP